MRLLQVTPVYFPELEFGGPPVKIHALCRGLIRLGHHVEVVTFDSKRPRRQETAEVDGVPVHYLPWAGHGLRQFPLTFGRLCQCVVVADVVHGFGLYNSLVPLAARSARRTGHPFVLEPLGMFPPRGRNRLLKQLYNRLVTARLARGAAAVIATSDAEQRDLAVLVPKGRLFLRENGLEVSRFARLPSPEPLRKRWGLRDNEKVALFIGRISPIKNLDSLVRAFDSAALENVRLVLAGPLAERDHVASLQQIIHELGARDRILLPGPVYGGDLLAALAMADLFVLPSISESFGNAAAEAVAAGVPVLLTETCGIAPRIHGRAGLAVSCTVSALSDGLRLLLTDSAQRSACTARRAEVLTELSWDKPLSRMEWIYQQLRLAPA